MFTYVVNVTLLLDKWYHNDNSVYQHIITTLLASTSIERLTSTESTTSTRDQASTRSPAIQLLLEGRDIETIYKELKTADLSTKAKIDVPDSPEEILKLVEKLLKLLAKIVELARNELFESTNPSFEPSALPTNKLIA